MPFPRTVILCLVVSLRFFGAITQDSSDSTGLSKRPIIAATALEENPVVDGDVPKDEIGLGIPAFGDLTQARPNFGRPASEKTEIRGAILPKLSMCPWSATTNAPINP